MDKLKTLLRWIPAFFMMAGIFWVSSLPSYVVPSFDVYDFIVKKGAHMIGYGLLAKAYLYGLGGGNLRQKRLAWVLALIFAVSDEWHQSFVVGRYASLMDVVFDALGAGIGLWTVWKR